MASISRLRPANAEGLLQRWCEDLIAAEVTRLSRRVPALQEEQLGRVTAALGTVIERLALSRIHAIRSDDLTVLFDLADVRR